MYHKTFEQSEHQVTFSFQPEENTAIWAAISGNAILCHLLVCMNIQSQKQNRVNYWLCIFKYNTLFNLKIRAGLLKCVLKWNCYKYSVSAIEKNTWNNNAVAINWLRAARKCCWLLCARRERTHRGWNLCTACVVNESVQMVMLHFCWIKNAKWWLCLKTVVARWWMSGLVISGMHPVESSSSLAWSISAYAI